MSRPPAMSVEDKQRIVLSVLSGEMTLAEAAPGQAGDNPQLLPLLEHIAVPRVSFQSRRVSCAVASSSLGGTLAAAGKATFADQVRIDGVTYVDSSLNDRKPLRPWLPGKIGSKMTGTYGR